MKKTILSLLAITLVLSLSAQRTIKELNKTQIQRCHTAEKMDELRQLDPYGYDQHKAAQEQLLQQWIKKEYPNWQANRAVLTIPVVVQIFGSTANSNVTDNCVAEQLAVLNEDFRRQNADASNTPSAFTSVAADCEIEFCLATLDPNNQSTTGIIRKTSSNSPSQSDLWNTSQYLNLLVYNIGGGTLGYTYLPSQAPNNGVHISYQYFGKSCAQSPFNRGRTATHEVGHWFNLEHVWGDSNCGNDFVSDTPEADQAHYNCPSHPHHTNNCGGGSSPNGEMFMNYMDYVNDNCMNLFTEGQKSRMIAAINTYRPGLLNNGKCGTISNPPVADFSASSTTITVGSCVNFTDLSSNTPTAWSWTFSGAATTSSSSQNPMNICYNAVGCFDVSLTATNADGSDTKTTTCYINVLDTSGGSCDTLHWPLPGSMTVYTTSDASACGTGGFLAGHNAYCDISKVDYFDSYTPYTQVDGVMLGFAAAADGGNGTNVAVNVYNDNSGSPGSIVGTINVPISQIVTDVNNQAYTTVMFASPVTIPGNFYVGINYPFPYTSGDTVALATNTDGDTNPGTAWEEWNDNSWHPYSELNTGWGINVSNAVFPIVCTGSSGCPTISSSYTVNQPSCAGGDGSATATGSGGQSPYSFQWDASTGNQTTATATGLSAGTYSYTVTDANICTGAGSVTLTAPSSPTLSVSSTNSSCVTDDGTATATGSGGQTPYTYTWDASAGNQTTATATGLGAGSYSVTVLDANGCSASGNASVSNTGAPSVTSSTVDESATGACDGSATVTATGGQTPYTYQWNSNAGNQTTATATGLCAGTYSVVVTDANGCSAVVDVTVSTAVGVNGLEQNHVFNLYPNPTDEIINLEIDLTSPNHVNVLIYNAIGQVVLSQELKDFKQGKLQYNLAGKSKGLYFVSIATQNEKVIKKVSLQ